MSDVPPRNGLAKAPGSGSTAAPSSAQSSAPQSSPPQDIVLLGPPTADGAGVHVIRARDERVETGELRALQEGRPIVGEIVTLKPRDSNPRVCDVTESYAPRGAQTAQLGHKGPAKVANDAYRDGWDEIFGAKPVPPGAAN